MTFAELLGVGILFLFGSMLLHELAHWAVLKINGVTPVRFGVDRWGPHIAYPKGTDQSTISESAIAAIIAGAVPAVLSTLYNPVFFSVLVIYLYGCSSDFSDIIDSHFGFSEASEHD